MKRVFVLAFLPLVLFGFETVNLLKDHSFEKDSEVWATSEGSKWAGVGEDSAIVNRHDSQSSFDGSFSASGDTRTTPAWVGSGGFDSAMIICSFDNKKIVDLDSLIWNQRVIGKYDMYTLTILSVVGFILDANSTNWLGFGYRFTNPSFTWGAYPGWFYEDYDMPEDTFWQECAHSLREDLINSHGFSEETTLDSFLIISWGYWYDSDTWYGQKVYWDDIRLMGYADYDVGVKEILSGDSLEAGTPYQPVARIKNFGRENADSFLVIAEIKDGASLIYVDTLPWSLEGDTEDTVEFAQFIPASGGEFTLTVRTEMDPDESDADDEVSKALTVTGIEEAPIVSNLQLVLNQSLSVGVLKVSYSIPSNQQGMLTLYDATGRRIERMALKGSGRVELGAGLASGVYIVRLECDSSSAAKKAVVLK